MLPRPTHPFLCPALCALAFTLSTAAVPAGAALHSRHAHRAPAGAESGFKVKVAARKAKIVALRKRLKNLSAKRAAKRAEIRETRQTQHRLSDQVNQSYEQLETAQNALKDSARKLRQAEVAVADAGKRLHDAELRLAVQQRRFGRRIAVSYRDGAVSYADVLLGARNLSDFMDRQYYVSRVVSQDAGLLAELREAQREVARQRRQVLQRQAALAQAHRENADWVQRVAAQAEAREKLLRAVQNEAALQEQQLQELEQDSQDVQGALERELARRLANPRAYHALPAWSGRFLLPARGRITSGFGYRYHPVLHYQRLHSGIDIGVGVGSPVFAAADGEVFFASLRGGMAAV